MTVAGYYVSAGSRGKCLCLGLGWCVALSAAAGCATTEVQVSAVQTREGAITIPTYEWGPDDVNPHFPWTFGRPIYPYPMQDNLGREKKDRKYATLVMENAYLRVTVIPELGGHVHSVLDKTTGREMFYVNQVIKAGLIGIRGAWISGGIEFNTGPHGHTLTAVSPVSCRFVADEDGSKSIAIGNVERAFRTHWVAVVTLRPDRSFLEERIRLYNPTPHVHPYYFWNCTAVPNTDGTQFVYPMTLGTDHSGTQFFRWPIDNGVDLSMSKNYRAPTSIFAYRCDQDFFGSYDHEADAGVVAYANRFRLPGKKAWTWGRGPEGIVAQSTLTDDGSLYNEVQTGPLATQADYGLLRPHQTVEWKEWWYPVHGLGGFDFATRDVAVKVSTGEGAASPSLKLIGTGTWPGAVCEIVKDGKTVAKRRVSISPKQPAVVALGAVSGPFEVRIMAGSQILAAFTHPLPLPKYDPPDLSDRKNPMKTARDHWAAGVAQDKASHADKAREHYRKSLELQPDYAPAHLALAALDLESGLPKEAKVHAEQVLQRDRDDGRAHYYLAQALLELGEEGGALDHAWLAGRDTATDSIGLALAAEIHIRQRRWAEAIDALWGALLKDIQDNYSRNLLSFALRQSGRESEAITFARQSLENNPLDPFAAWILIRPGTTRSIRGSAASDSEKAVLEPLVFQEDAALELAAILYRLKAYDESLWVVRNSIRRNDSQVTAITYYYAAVLADLLGKRDEPKLFFNRAVKRSPDCVFPVRLETMAILEHAAKRRPDDWQIHHYLGCLYLAKYRKEEAVAAWKKALSLHDGYSVVHRNLGLVRWKLEGDAKGAIGHFEKALACRRDDQTLYRDLGKLYQETDQWPKARDLLEKTLPFERYRSDVIELLARAYHKLGQDAEAAKLIDLRTFDAWEAQRSLYEIYKDVHISLGRQALEAGEAEQAVAEFRRSLTYPDNLRVGRPEDAVEAEQYYWLGKALAAAKKTDEARKAWQRAAKEGSKKSGDYPDLAVKALKELDAR